MVFLRGWIICARLVTVGWEGGRYMGEASAQGGGQTVSLEQVGLRMLAACARKESDSMADWRHDWRCEVGRGSIHVGACYKTHWRCIDRVLV